MRRGIFSTRATKRHNRRSSAWPPNIGRQIGCRHLVVEPLEDRTLLAVDILGVTSAWGDFRFIADAQIPEVLNTYTAQVAGNPSRVVFQIGGQQVTDSNPADGWAGQFNMSALTSVSDLVVNAYEGSSLADSFTYDVDMILLPSWMQEAKVEFSASVSETTGYAFEVYYKDLDYGFSTPTSWKWTPPYFNDPLIDLGGLRTGFDTGWDFSLVSSPSGDVQATDTGYRVHSEIMGVDIWDYKLLTGVDGDFEAGPASGSYSISFNPAFNSDLTWAGVSGTAQFNMGLEYEWSEPLVDVPIYGLPFVKVGVASFEVGVGFNIGVDFDASATVVLADGQLRTSNATIHPSVEANVSAYADLNIGNLGPWTFAKAGVEVAGTVTQDFTAQCENNTWSYDAPGSLTFSGNLNWEAVFGLFEGGVDLFNWKVASWNFVPQTGSGSEQTSLPAPADSGPPAFAILEGNHFSFAGAAWEDKGWSGNDNDGVIEAGEHPRLRVNLTSTGNASNVEAVLGAEDSDISVTERNVYFDDFFTGVTQGSVSRFLVETTFSDHRDENFNLYITYKIGDQWYYQNLQFPEETTFYAQGELGADFVVSSVSIDDPSSISGNNGNGNAESGEDIWFRPAIANVGGARATFVDAYLTTDQPGVYTPPNNAKEYPDLLPGHIGQPESKPGVADYFLVRIDEGFTGVIWFDLHIMYEENQQQEVVIENAFSVNVGTAAWLAVDPREYSFDVASPDASESYQIKISNPGTEGLIVTGIQAPASVQVSETGFPITIAPGTQEEWTVTIDTSDLKGEVSLPITVETSNGRIINDTSTATGLVCSSTPAYSVPGTEQGEDFADVSGDIVVWSGWDKVHAYNLRTGTPISGFEPDGSRPFISGNIVAWEVWHEDTRQHDVYAFDITTGETYSVATTIADETLIGVDGLYVAFVRTEYTFPETAENPGVIKNLFLYDVSNVIQPETRVTDYGRSGYDPVLTVEDGDFAGSVLAWNETIYVWSTTYWRRTRGSLQKYEPGKDTAPQEIVGGDLAPGTPSVNLDASGNAQIVWRQTYERRNVTLYASDDTYYEGRRNGSNTDGGNNGDDGTLIVSATDTSATSIIRSSLIKFDLNTPIDSTTVGQELGQIESAVIHAYMRAQYGSGMPYISLFEVAENWSEHDVTGANHPDLGSRLTPAYTAWYQGWNTCDVTSSSETLQYGIELRPGVDYYTDSIARMDFNASEYGSNIPYLTLQYRTVATNQWFAWEDGETTKLTHSISTTEGNTTSWVSGDYYDPVAGNGVIVAQRDDTDHDLFFWSINAEGMIDEDQPVRLSKTDSSRETETNFGWRSDGNVVVWPDVDGVWFAYLNQPDLVIDSMDIVASQEIVEGTATSFQVTVHSVAPTDPTSDVKVELFDGDPDMGGQPLGTATILASVNWSYPQTVTISDVLVGVEGTHHIYSRIAPTFQDNPMGNKASVDVVVQDSDTEGPAISDIHIEEDLGNGDGIIASNEQVRIRWHLSDPSGIGATSVLVDDAFKLDGVAGPDAGDYTVVYDPLIAGPHTYTIIAADADDSPASSQHSGSFDVVTPEIMSIVVNGDRVESGSTVTIGTFARGEVNATVVFTVKNLGEQTLTLGNLGVQAIEGDETDTPPALPFVMPAKATYFTITPDTSTAGSFRFEVSLPNSDQPSFNITVTGTVEEVTDQQVITPNPTMRIVSPGNPVSIDVNYTTNPIDPTLTGLGLRIHYDSSQLTYNDSTNLLSTGFIQQSSPMDDTADYDEDATTDKYVLVSWADMTGYWPNQDSARLLTANFTSVGTASGSTHVNFSASSTASGWTLEATSAAITFDSTVPIVVLTAPTFTNDTTPSVTVAATDDGSGVPDGTAVALDVDLNNNGDFADAGEADYVTSTLTAGSAVFDVAPALTEGTHRLRARVSDEAGNEGTSDISTIVVDTTRPTVAIGLPSVPITAGGPVRYEVTYADANLGEVSLSASDIVLEATGTATGAVNVEAPITVAIYDPTMPKVFWVTISDIAGDGTLRFWLTPGTAHDFAGNPDQGATSDPFTVDNTAPSVTIGPPSTTITGNGPVSYVVTYADANLGAITLEASDVTLNKTGTATGTVHVSGTGLTRTVTISNISGDGTLGISLAEGTASDLAGNPAPPAGPSETFVVDASLPMQVVSGSPDTRNIVPGQTFNFAVEYTTSDSDKTVTGLGLRVHYNSSVLAFNSLSYVLAAGFVQQQAPVADTADYDHDPTTDKFILVSWADVTGNWPDMDLPVTLLMPSFTLASGVTVDTSTTVRFSASSTAASHQFSSTPVTVTAVAANLDVDGDGQATADGDGLLLMEYAFGFRDPIVPTDVVAMLDAELQRAKNGQPSFLNPDGSASRVGDALNDGILVGRYLRYYQYPSETHWKGPDLIQDALMPGDPSPAPSWQDIWNILDSFNPVMPVPTVESASFAASMNTTGESAPSGQGLLAADEPAPILALQAESRQIVTPDPVSQTVSPGDPVILHVNYSTDPADASLTGLGLRMHYNSDMLSFGGIADRLGTGFVEEQTPVDDTEDFDADPLTDKYVLISWADLEGNWPGQLDIRLFTSNYTAQADSGSTSVNFTASSTAADWALDATPAVINFEAAASGSIYGWVYADANRNGQPDAGESLPGVAVSLTGTAQKTTTTDDNGWYQFDDVPAGGNQVSVAHPKACRPGGPDSTTVDMEGGQSYRVDFWDAGLRPEYIPNRLLATSTQPPGSARWNQVIRDTLARAEQQYTQSAQSSAVAVQQPATAQPIVVAQPVMDAQPVIVVPSTVVDNTATASKPDSPASATQAPAQSPAQTAATPAQPKEAAVVTQETITPIVEEAIARWAAAGLDQQTINSLQGTTFVVSDLAGSYLGMTCGNMVHLDQDAAGRGWFVDPTPSVDEEFTTTANSDQLRAVDSRAVDHMDLLTVVEHELGHIAGLGDLESSLDDLMSSMLSKGVRRSVSVSNVDAVFAGYSAAS